MPTKNSTTEKSRRKSHQFDRQAEAVKFAIRLLRSGNWSPANALMKTRETFGVDPRVIAPLVGLQIGPMNFVSWIEQ